MYLTNYTRECSFISCPLRAGKTFTNIKKRKREKQSLDSGRTWQMSPRPKGEGQRPRNESRGCHACFDVE